MTSMLYRDHGLGAPFDRDGRYFGDNVDEDALTNYFSTNVGTSDYSAYQTYYGRGYLCQAVLLDSAMELVTSSAVRA